MNACVQLATAEKTTNKNIPKNNLYTWAQLATAVSKESNHIWKRNMSASILMSLPLCQRSKLL